jgi:colicin import membrane protein
MEASLEKAKVEGAAEEKQMSERQTERDLEARLAANEKARDQQLADVEASREEVKITQRIVAKELETFCRDKEQAEASAKAAAASHSAAMSKAEQEAKAAAASVASKRSAVTSRLAAERQKSEAAHA